MKKNIKQYAGKVKVRATRATTRSKVLVFALVFGFIGLSTLLITRAATPTASFEAESATKTGNVSLVNDAAASGGQALMFSAPSSGLQPEGNPLGRTWTQVFGDEFTGTALDTSKWVYLNGFGNNNVTSNAKNCSVGGGHLVLSLPGDGTGCEVSTSKRFGAGVSGRDFNVGDYLEARIWFPGPGTAPTATLYNWPAFWAYDWSGNWDAAENDIAEAINWMQYNYHSSSTSSHIYPSGNWGNSWHVYAAYREANQIQVFYDGVFKGSLKTADNGGAEAIIINSGKSLAAGGAPEMYGSAGDVKVDWVRSWR